ncbi:IS200/IS605 family transposase [Pelotomaculum isophthalicicum JI]|uniref:IS200/IS605 family transposase n=1 Tax=Pelotomaculum isophthalicicum JI TaxID=947010 RepID=A0A9X4JVD5_9FIRM|nr:IS200/IS605 family transposase [Pelotomaculum isophthalicicum]MDF9407197.1 IS200/IS605 family transposase [Pelotomaculum isophthalicicum JI]
MADYQKGSHTIYDIKYHFVWITKYRCHVLKDQVAVRLRDLIRQGCEVRGITIIKGSIGKDHVHLLLECPPQLSPSKIVQYLKGRSSRLIQDEFPHLKKRYWGQHLWARGYFCGTVGTVTDQMIRDYIEHQDAHGDEESFKITD